MSSDEAQSSVRKNTERVSTEPDDMAELFRVGVRVPPFWPKNPRLWFAQIEAQFAVARITDDNTKFYYVTSNLDEQYLETVDDVLMNPPVTGKYEKLKHELIKRLSASRQKKVQQLLQSEELGDRKPSQFLRHLQHLAGPNVPDEFIQDVWTSRLPSGLQTIIASQQNQSLQALADLADQVHDIAPASPQVASTAAMARMESFMATMVQQVTALTQQELETIIIISSFGGAWLLLLIICIVLCTQVTSLRRKVELMQHTGRIRVQKLKMDSDKNHAFHNPALSPDEELSRRGFSMYQLPDEDVESGIGRSTERQTGGQFIEELSREIDRRENRQSTAPPFLLQSIEENKRKSRSLVNPVAKNGRASDTNPNFIY